MTLTITRPIFEALQRLLKNTPLNADDGSVVNVALVESAAGVVTLGTVPSQANEEEDDGGH